MKQPKESYSIFGDRQSKFLAFVTCFAGGLLLTCLLSAVVFILNRAFDVFGGVIWSLALSGMLAILLRPIVTLFEEHFNLGRLASILLLYLLVIGSSGSMLWFFGGKIISQTQDLVGSAAEWPEKLEQKAKKSLPPETWEAVSDQVEAFKKYWEDLLVIDTSIVSLKISPDQELIYNSLNLTDREIFQSLDEVERADFFSVESPEERIAYLERKGTEMRNRAMENIEQQGEQIAQKSAEVLKSAWSGLLSIFTKITYLAVIPIYLFYFLGSNRNLIDDLERELTFLSDSIRDDIVFLIREFVGILVSFFRGQLLIGLLMGVGYSVGFSLSGLKFGITLGLLFGLLNVIPYLGSIVGIATTLLVAYLQPLGIAETGEWGVLIGCGACFVVVQLIESYYLTPKIMGQQTGLHPVVVMVSIFFWGTALGGILGMIFGIPLTAFIIIAWRLVCRKYLSRSSS